MEKRNKLRIIIFSVFAAVFIAFVIVGAVLVNAPAGNNEIYSAVKVALEKQTKPRGYVFKAEITTINTDGSKDFLLYDQTEDWDAVNGYREVNFLKRQIHEEGGESEEISRTEYSTRVVRYLKEFWYLVEYAGDIADTKMRIDNTFAASNIPDKSGTLDSADMRVKFFEAKEDLLNVVEVKAYDDAKRAVDEFNSGTTATQKELLLSSSETGFVLSLKETTGVNYKVWTVYVSMNSVDKIAYQSYEKSEVTEIFSDYTLSVVKNMKRFNNAIMPEELENYEEVDTLTVL